MDSEYIRQLLERYWEGETSIEEERTLRSYFCQEDAVSGNGGAAGSPEGIAADLEKYRGLFAYMQSEPEEDTLGGEFDDRVLSMIEERPVVKARVITISQRLAPLFKAAAVVAIFLTFSQAAQMSFRDKGYENVRSYEQPAEGDAVALTDTLRADTVQCGMADIGDADEPPVFK